MLSELIASLGEQYLKTGDVPVMVRVPIQAPVAHLADQPQGYYSYPSLEHCVDYRCAFIEIL